MTPPQVNCGLGQLQIQDVQEHVGLQLIQYAEDEDSPIGSSSHTSSSTELIPDVAEAMQTGVTSCATSTGVQASVCSIDVATQTEVLCHADNHPHGASSSTDQPPNSSCPIVMAVSGPTFSQAAEDMATNTAEVKKNHCPTNKISDLARLFEPSNANEEKSQDSCLVEQNDRRNPLVRPSFADRRWSGWCKPTRLQW